MSVTSSTTQPPLWAPHEIPIDRPSVARMYDYYLGGAHNFAVDRQAAQRAMDIYPELPLVMQANRGFLRRAVAFLAEQGIDQFLDIGSGIPTAGNVHEVAQRVNPDASIVYVDIDHVAVAHSEVLLRDNPRAGVIQADARQIEQVLAHPEVARLLDFRRPVAVLLVSLLHFIPDDGEAYGLVRALRQVVPSGSYLALAHASTEGLPAATREQIVRLYGGASSPICFRSQDEIGRFFEGLEPVHPGLVYLSQWRPEGVEDLFADRPERCIGLAGMGRKA